MDSLLICATTVVGGVGKVVERHDYFFPCLCGKCFVFSHSKSCLESVGTDRERREEERTGFIRFIIISSIIPHPFTPQVCMVIRLPTLIS